MRRKAHFYFGGGMEEQLSLLIQLQEIDTRIRSLQEKKNKYPEILAALEQRRSESKADLERTREGLQTAQKNKRERDKDLEAGAAKVEKLKARTSEIKTNKEYQALLKEIETAEQENKAIEEDILVLMEKIETAAAAISGAETRARDEETALVAEQKDHEAAFRAVEAELGSLTQERQEKTAGVQAGLLAQYEKLAASKGVALAEARGEACSGCYMSIPPQVFVNVKKNESVINCPHCGRMLYYKG
jgi:predicted  nucleic acid-binding Zn-ribbon protein